MLPPFQASHLRSKKEEGRKKEPVSAHVEAKAFLESFSWLPLMSHWPELVTPAAKEAEKESIKLGICCPVYQHFVNREADELCWLITASITTLKFRKDPRERKNSEVSEIKHLQLL